MLMMVMCYGVLTLMLCVCMCCVLQAYAAGDGLACHNLIMLLAYCYSAGLVASDCMYR